MRETDCSVVECAGWEVYRSLFENLPLPAWVYDTRTLCFVEVNQAASRRYGFSRAEFLAMTILEIRPPEDAPALLEFLEQPLDRRNARAGTWRHRAKDGGVFEVETTANRLAFEDRDAMLVVAREISARRRAEQELRRAEEAYRALFDDAPVPYHELDRNGVVVRVNRAQCELLGVEAADVIGRPVWDLVSPAEREFTRRRVAQELRERQPMAPFERRYVGRDGVERVLQVHGCPIVGPAGEITGIRAAMLDLTESRKAERQIQFQASLLDQVRDAVVAVDETFRVTYWNRGAELMFGRSSREVHGMDYGEAVQDALDSAERAALRRRLLADGEVRKELHCRNRLGDPVPVELSATLLRDDSGQVVGAVGIHRDITERRRAEKALEASENRFNLAQSALGIGAWEVDLQTGSSVCSPEICRIYGVPADTCGFKSSEDWLQHIHPADRERVAEEFRSKVTKEPCHREYRAVWPDGSVRWIFSKSTVTLNEDGQPRTVLGVSFDITAQKQKEEQLRILSSAVEQSPVSIVITDLSGSIQYSNPKTSEVTGYSREELLGRNPRLLRSGHTSPEEYRELWRTVAHGVWHGVFHNKRKNGELFWEAATIGPIRDESGAVTHYLAVKEDITERRAMEAALKFSEERFRVAAQCSGDIVYEWDIASDKVRFLGCKSIKATIDENGEPFSGSRVFSSIHESDRARVMAAIRRNLESGEPYQEEYRIVVPTGEIRHWSDSGSALRDASGRPYKWVGVVKDVTEARQAERANAELAAIVESTETAIFTRDLNSVALSWNAGAERIYGYTAAEMIGQDLRITVPPDHWDEIAMVGGKIRAGERINHLETVRLTKSGARIEVMMAMSPIFDRSGLVVGSAHMVWDISEFRRLQRQLGQAQKLESVGQLAAGIAHEINTPIQYIGDNAQFLASAFQDLARVIQLQDVVARALRSAPAPQLAEQLQRTLSEVDAGYLCEEVPKAIAQLSEGAQQVARIVRAMKEFSHPGTAEKTMLDLNRAIESTVVVSRNEWKYVADLTTELDPGLPLVSCLAGEFNQVMLNLIVNAAHAIGDMVKDSGRKGQIHISTRSSGKCVEIRVRDTGTGIPEAIRSKVFDPFFTTKEVGKGTGQGLSIAHNVIVKKHNGTLSFETECGSGTTFLIQLPLEAKETCS